MKNLWIAAFAMVVMNNVHATVAMPVGSVKAGQAASAPCAACHSADGNSTSAAFPRLAGQNAKYIFKQISDFKSGKRQSTNSQYPLMAGVIANLTPQQIADLAAYFSAQKAYVDLSDDATFAAGEKLFRGGDSTRGIVPCAGCHGPAGKGNKFAAFPKIGGQHADYIKTQLNAFRAAGRKDLTNDNKRTNDAAKAGELGMMQTVASKLSDQDIADLANFMAGLH